MNRLGAFLYVLVLPLSASLLGCFCDDHLVITEEFENFCDDGQPCRWEATGPVSQVPTFHTGVYGVAIPAGTTLTSAESFGSRRTGVLVQCDETASIQFNGTPASPPSDTFVWLYATQTGPTTLTVTGSGQCIVDDAGFIDNCDDFE